MDKRGKMMEVRVQKPDWIKVRAGTGQAFPKVRETLAELGVRTVCDPSHCPNIGECWSKGTATFLILGDKCTRDCRFCSVPFAEQGSPTDHTEPSRVAEAVRRLQLNHVVVTSVTRDDLEDGGASAYFDVIDAIKKSRPECSVEVLVPDMGGSHENISKVLSASPDILGHNIETVERLTPVIRDEKASYITSLQVLKASKEISPRTITKSSLMVGLGESRHELSRTMNDIRDVGTDMLTIGQYLRPCKDQVPVTRYIPPEEFVELKHEALELGFMHVSSGPFVRSSYMAKEAFDSIRRSE